MPAREHRLAVARLPMLVAAAVLVAACAGPLASPSPVPAGADMRTETRQVAGFTSVSVEGHLNLVVGTGDAAKVDIEAPTNILPLVTTVVTGSDLAVAVAPPGFTSAKSVTVRVTLPKLTAVSLDGGAQGSLEVMTQVLAVSVAGGSVLKAIGSVQQLSVTSLGNSDAQLGDLAADSAAISAAGGAKATLRVKKQLTGTADGGSIVTLVVAPVARSVTVTGGASVVGP